MQLTTLMNELAEDRRENPTDDLTSALVHNDLGEDMLAPNEIAPFFILLAVAGNDTTRTAISLGMHLLAAEPRAAARSGRTTSTGVTATAVEEIVRVRVAGHVHAPHRHPRPDAVGPRVRRGRQARPLLRRRQPRSRGCSTIPSGSTCAATRTPTSASAARARTSASAPTSPAASWRWCSASCSPACPTSRSSATRCRSKPMGIPLVGGIKHLPVRFTPTKRVNPN